MGKAEKGTPKDIAKRIKAKGLQKLKFWCQVCEKQCRDANGFKCHLTSESHLRQIKLFSEQSTGRLNSYSREFEATFLSTLRVRHTTTEVNANNVYQEVIQDRHHVHMNSTIWATLGDFVKYLGRTGKCHVRETDRGWYVSYIEQDAAKLAQQVSYQQRQEAEQEAERVERNRMARQRQEAAKALDRIHVDPETRATELDPNRDTSIKVTIHGGGVVAAAKKGNGQSPLEATTNIFGGDDDDESDDDNDDGPPPGVPLPASLASKPLSSTAPASAWSSRPQRERDNDPLRRYRQPNTGSTSRVEPNRVDGGDARSSWLLPDVLVRILDKKSQFYDRKAVVNRVRIVADNKNDSDEKVVADVTILDTGRDKNDGGQEVTIRASKLETVVPKEGKRVRVLRGRHRGRFAIVVERNERKGRATLQLDDGSRSSTGEVLERVPYDDFSKAA